MKSPKYKRVLLKISGEAFSPEGMTGLTHDAVKSYAKEIIALQTSGSQVAIVVGAGNFIRGRALKADGFDSVTSDQMGMLATVINGLVLRDALVAEMGASKVVLMSAFPVGGFAELFNRQKAQAALEENKIVIFVGGTGNPLVTTDTASVLRGVEIGAECILKATKVDGVYSADPEKDKSATRYDVLTYTEVIASRLSVMDLAAILLSQSNALPICVFDLKTRGILQQVVRGEGRFTIIKGD